MRKNVGLLSLIFMMMLMMAACQVSADTYPTAALEESTAATECAAPTQITEIEVDTTLLEIAVHERIEPETLEEANEALRSALDRHLEALNVYNSLRALGYDVNHPIIQLMSEHIDNAAQDTIYYEEIQREFQNQLLWEMRAIEYPIATKVWLFMKEEMGWSDYVCAGVMGNMMAECGGKGLNLNPGAVGSYRGETYYGICQWSTGYKIHGADLEAQLQLIKETVPKTFNTTWSANLYCKGFDYEQFLALEDCGDAAVAFAKVYERCASRYVEMRRELAEQAYEYFTS